MRVHKTQDETNRPKTQHKMCWTPPYSRRRQYTSNYSMIVYYKIVITISTLFILKT
jgi:hypothetical protein